MGESIYTKGVQAGNAMVVRPTSTARVSAQRAQELAERRLADERKHGINKGLNAKELDTITKVEKANQNAKKESGTIVDSNGNIVWQGQGKKRSVAIPHALMKDKIVTHNHPDAGISKGSLADRIGNTFSPDDVMGAINGNAKEFRASAAGYTYSMRRPEGGWGIRPADFYSAYKREFKKQSQGMRDYVLTHKENGRRVENDKATIDQRNARYNLIVQERVMKALAKQFGFEYTRRKY